MKEKKPKELPVIGSRYADSRLEARLRSESITPSCRQSDFAGYLSVEDERVQRALLARRTVDLRGWASYACLVTLTGLGIAIELGWIRL